MANTEWPTMTSAVIRRVRGGVRNVSVVVLIGSLLAGCAIRHDYEWSEYPISPDRISALPVPGFGSAISVINRQSDDELRLLGTLGAHEYYGSLSQLSEAIVTQLSQELGKRDVSVRADAAKSLEVMVTGTELVVGQYTWRANLDVHIHAGNHHARRFSVSNKTRGWGAHAFNGAVALAVIEVLNDPEIIAYLQR